MSGVIYYLNENGSCMEVLQADGAIRSLLYHELGEILVVVTESLVVGQFRVEPDGSLVEMSKVKMSSRSADCSITWEIGHQNHWQGLGWRSSICRGDQTTTYSV